MITLNTRRCWQDGECFARVGGQCKILMETSKGKCSFQKKNRYITNGVYYPMNPAYGHKEEIIERVDIWESHFEDGEDGKNV